MIIKTFGVDAERYPLSKHDYLLATTEYTFGNTCLSKQMIYPELRKKAQQSLQSADRIGLKPPQEQYYISKTYDGKCRRIEFATFMKRLNDFPQGEIRVLQEYFEQVQYYDKSGKAASVGIAVLKEGNVFTKATIEFQSGDEMEEFILPEWLYLNH
jgi:hypothetical protein